MRREKLIQKMRNNPKAIKFSEAETLIHSEGWIVDNIVGSHYTFLKGKQRFVLVKPHGRQKYLHPKDVKKILRKLELEEEVSKNEGI